MKKEGIKMNQLHPGSYRDGKDIRVGQGAKYSDSFRN